MSGPSFSPVSGTHRRFRFGRVGAALVAAAFAASLLVACGSDDKSTGTSTVQGDPEAELKKYLDAPTALSVDKPLSQAPPKGKKIYFMQNGLPVGKLKEQGVQEGSEALGWNFESISFDQKNPASLNSGMTSAINAGADIIVISAVDAKQIEPALALAQEKNVIVIDDASGNPKTPGITVRLENEATSTEWGRILGLGILADIKKNKRAGHVVQVSAPIFSTILEPTNKKLKETLEKYCKKCTYDQLDISGNDLYAQKTPQVLVSYLQKNPTVDYVSFCLSAAESGTAPALQAAGLDKKVRVFGKGPLASHLTEMQGGNTHGWIAVPFVLTGWMMADAAARAVVGDPTDVYEKVGTPSWFVTQDTDFAPDTAMAVPSDHADRFAKIWKLSS